MKKRERKYLICKKIKRYGFRSFTVKSFELSKILTDNIGMIIPNSVTIEYK